MQRKIFRGVGAMVARLVTHRRFYIVTKVTSKQVFSFEHDRQIEIDLDLTPSLGPWDQVKIDDRGIDKERKPLAGDMNTLLSGYHITSIGGFIGAGLADDMSRGRLVGSVYLEDGYFQQVRDKIDLDGNPWPCDGRKTYQLTTVAYSNHGDNGPRRGLRYAGFEGKLIRKLAGTRRAIQMFNLFGEPLAPGEIEIEIDLASPAECDDHPPLARGEVGLTVDSKEGDQGAIFLELGLVAAREVENPKLPIGMGS